MEELATSERTLALMREQFETNVFAPINIIKSALPAMREKKGGHIMVLTGISKFLNYIKLFSANWLPPLYVTAD